MTLTGFRSFMLFTTWAAFVPLAEKDLDATLDRLAAMPGKEI